MRFIIFIFLLGVAGAPAVGQKTGPPDSQEYRTVTSCEVQYQLVMLSVMRSVGHMYILADGRHFNEKDLTKLFRCISRNYPEYTTLVVTLFDDRDYLRVAIRNHFYPPPDDNPPEDTSKEDCLDWKRATRPCPYGYYRAYYHRSGNREILAFSEEPSKKVTRRIELKK